MEKKLVDTTEFMSLSDDVLDQLSRDEVFLITGGAGSGANNSGTGCDCDQPSNSGTGCHC